MKLYDKNDMVKVGCHDCKGCSDCCRGMGDTIILDPFDIWQLTCGLEKEFNELLEQTIGLHVEEGIILPHLKMTDGNGQCVYLDENNRCSIHGIRPGLCRLFPLGRSYEEGTLRYFLLESCPAQNKTKIKIEKWLQMKELTAYEKFLNEWHFFLKACRGKVEELYTVTETDDAQEEIRNINMRLLQVFYMTPYLKNVDFFSQFKERIKLFKL